MALKLALKEEAWPGRGQRENGPPEESESTSKSKEVAKTECAAAAKLLQSCLTLCDPIDGSPPGSPVPEILQARTLE